MHRSYEDILKFSPHAELREIQVEALQKAYEILQSDKKYLILELPPGVGKSAVGWILAHAFDKAYFVTIQKLLQDQYVREMGDKMVILKGKNTYQCAHFPEYDCEEALCSVRPSLKLEHGISCPYKKAVVEAQNADYTLFNMHSFYYQYRYGHFKEMKRKCLIIDEGHLIENGFMSFIETTIIEGGVVPHIPEYEDTKDYMDFLKDACEKIRDIIESSDISDLKESSAGDPDFQVDQKEMKRIIKLQRLLVKIINLINDMEDGNEWLHLIQEDQDRRKIIFKPLYVDRFISEFLYSASEEKIIIMSATIGSFKEFCNRNGIPKEEASIIRGPSPFPIENRQIYYEGKGSMGRKHFEKSYPKVLNRIQEILEMYPEEKGVIQSHSEWLTNMIVKDLDKLPHLSDRITVKNGDVFKMLEDHENKDASVIVASGISTGLDLKNELARFQIIVKVPYPDLGDPQMKRRFEISKEYYFYITALALMQTYGRGIRSVDDHADTFILDSDFGRFKHFNKELLSEWFLEALQ